MLLSNTIFSRMVTSDVTRLVKNGIHDFVIG